MALGTLVLGYCLMQFDNGTASSGLSALRRHDHDVYCRVCDERGAGGVDPLLRIQPLKCRDFGITCSTTTNWVSNMIIGATFLTLLDAIGAAGWLYGAQRGLYRHHLLADPETKNVTLEHIERNLMAGEAAQHR